MRSRAETLARSGRHGTTALLAGTGAGADAAPLVTPDAPLGEGPGRAGGAERLAAAAVRLPDGLLQGTAELGFDVIALELVANPASGGRHGTQREAITLAKARGVGSSKRGAPNWRTSW